jgi:hypothetical protein
VSAEVELSTRRSCERSRGALRSSAWITLPLLSKAVTRPPNGDNSKRIQIQMEMTGVVQNLKRLANYVHRKPRQRAEAALRGITGALEGLSTLFRAAYSPYDALWSHQAVSGDATGRFNSDAPPTSTKRVDKSGVTETPASSTPF